MLGLLLATTAGAMVAVLYAPVVQQLVRVWLDDANYSHGFLVPVVSAMLVSRRRVAIAAQTGKGSPFGGAVLLGGLFLLVAGHAVGSVGSGRGGLFVMGISLLPVGCGLVLLLFGVNVLKQLAFPIAFLAFMVPLPVGLFATLTLPLQLYASNVTVIVLDLFGIPALREGNLIFLPAVTLGVEEACSGIRSLITLLAGTSALGWLVLDRPIYRLLLIASAIPVAIATNAVRVTGTGMLAYLIGPEVAKGFFHDFSSWLMLLVASVILCAEVFLLERLDQRARVARARP